MSPGECDDSVIVAVRSQIEFYFSEGNLPRDKFMKERIDKSSSKSISIDDLLTFNKLRSLGVTEEVILRAVSGSAIVEMNEEGSGVRRKSEMPALRSADGRTIYLGGVDQRETAEEVTDFLRNLLGTYGSISRIDVPKYPSSNALKGFAFVEFLTKTAAKNALKVYKPFYIDIRKVSAWKYFSYSNNQYNHALKQLEMLGYPQKLFFDDFLGEQRKIKSHDKLIAIAKKEWLIFRSQFYDAQKHHLSEMKVLINKYQSQLAAQNHCSHKLHERMKAEEISESIKTVTAYNQELSDNLISGSIVEFHCDEGSTKKTLKASLNVSSAYNDVAYIDFKDFSLSGFLRFKNSSSCADFIKNYQGFISVNLLTASQEQEYIDRITMDKEMKRELQKRKNQKKKNKIVKETISSKKMKTE